jgi:hypothetical protein
MFFVENFPLYIASSAIRKRSSLLFASSGYDATPKLAVILIVYPSFFRNSFLSIAFLSLSAIRKPDLGVV